MVEKMDIRTEIGIAGEQLVQKELKKRGFVIAALNYSCRRGEVDIIAEDASRRVFVEVKTRTKAYFSTSEVVNYAKQRKIIATAYYYNAAHVPKHDLIYRFDVALLEKEENGYTLNYIENAFSPSMEWI